MKPYELFLLLILICLSLENKEKEKLRKLEDVEGEDTNNVNTEDSDSEIDSISTDISTEEPSNGTNATMTDADTGIYEPPPPDEIKYNERPLIVLVGFGLFQTPPPPPFQPPIGLFTVYFKRILGDQVLSITIIVPMTITYVRRVRYLQEREENITENVNATCNRITPDSEDDIKYNCTFPMRNDSNLSTAETDNENIVYVGMESEVAKPNVILSSAANETSNKLETATGADLESGVAVLNKAELISKRDLNFALRGVFDDKNMKRAILSFDEDGKGTRIVNATCDIEKDGIYSIFNCTAEQSINRGKFLGLSGVDMDSIKKVLVYPQNEDDVLTIGNKQLYYKKSSSGLSGGSIAAIVIACVIALIAIAIIAMLCRKTNVKAPFQESTLGINGYNSTNSNNIE